MTAPTPPGPGPEAGPLVVAADGSYAARLVAVTAGDATGWCPERWTLDGPEPYAVRLPGSQPEEPDSPVVPLSDGRVLIGRRADGRYHFSLLYPSGPDTGELPLGAVECERLTLLPPAPDGVRVYALTSAERDDSAESTESAESAEEAADGTKTELWQVCGGVLGPELVARIDGRCGGGAWLDRDGRLLALDRTDGDGHTRAIAVTVDAPLGGPPSELLRIAEDSNDRLLLADPDSGLLLVSSDAPGQERIGWGVLGSHRPVRFPEALHQPGAALAPIAMQPGQVLVPEACGVALRMTTAEADWVAVWRPQQRELQHVAAPEGWLPGVGLWTAEGELLLPYASTEVACGLARVAVPVPTPAAGMAAGTGVGTPGGTSAAGTTVAGATTGVGEPAGSPAAGSAAGTAADGATTGAGSPAGTPAASEAASDVGSPVAGQVDGTDVFATPPAGTPAAGGAAADGTPTPMGWAPSTDAALRAKLETGTDPVAGAEHGTATGPATGGVRESTPGPGMAPSPEGASELGTPTDPATGADPQPGGGLAPVHGPETGIGHTGIGHGEETGPAAQTSQQPSPWLETAVDPGSGSGGPADDMVTEQAESPSAQPAEPAAEPPAPRPPTEVAKPVPLSQAPLARVG
jgi:hypothetical protein